ncbi:hypothetical protein DAEQUDRAFT_682638 [Daedalea quercina L-15889]|uniref:F-box domain-containing protein n=1 Tax=Daedalea quercina L-15889 TaxID=1314783 RepID=A0A165U9C7_9APHY|nr:hypothetical protein DAEQUDRAFT_682638 [Daedalea quercina L-15889]
MPPKKVMRSAGSLDVKGGANADSKGQAKGGGLKDIINAPTDIIQEILQYLHPRDLLSLSWVSKSFHAFLMKRSSASIWKRSLESVHDLPPCPDKLIEPAWAALLFSPHCTSCGSTGSTVEDPYWAFYARFCMRCSDACLVSDSRWDRPFEIEPDIRSEIPTNMFNLSSRHSFLSSTYLKSEVDELVENYKKMLEAGDEEELARFIGRQILRVRKIEKHAKLCYQWAKNYARLQEAERKQLQEERFNDIISRLRLLGWGPELSFLEREKYWALWQHKQVCVPKKLTDDAWEEMREEVTDIMQKIRGAHPHLHITEKLHGRLGALTCALKVLVQCPEIQAARMTVGDIALMPEVRDIMSSPEDVKVEESDLTVLQGQMGDMITRWQSRVHDYLRSLLAQAEGTNGDGDVPSGVDPLDLATTMFRCRLCHCNWEVFYPNILHHQCLRGRHTDLPKSDVYGTYILGNIDWRSLSRTSKYPYQIQGSVVAHTPSEKARELIRLCGKDPKTVTAKEMDAMDVRFVQDAGNIMTWRAAMLHQDLAKDCGGWRLASSDEVTQAKEREEAACRELQIKWICTMCPPGSEPILSWDNGADHLETNHNVKDRDAQREHLVLHADSRAASGVFKVNLQRGSASTVVC